MTHNFDKPELVNIIFKTARDLGHEARITGGAVRDFLANRDIKDIDMAVNVPITAIVEPLKNEGVRVYATGLSHGTITVVGYGTNIELTQTRKDTESVNNRHAVVEFTDDWKLDASRRDFTINAMYLTESGELYDPFNGLDDLKNNVLRFVGNAKERIDEDALRMLRYCRFSEYLDSEPSEEYVAEIASLVKNIESLSGERITQELKKIFEISDGKKALELMHKTNMDYVIFGSKIRMANSLYLPKFDIMTRMFGENAWLVYLGSILLDCQTDRLCERLRLSRHEAIIWRSFDNRNLYDFESEKWQQEVYYVIKDRLTPTMLYAVDMARKSKNIDPVFLKELSEWQRPEFPVYASDLISMGVEQGKEFGTILNSLEKQWVESDFQLTKEELL